MDRYLPGMILALLCSLFCLFALTEQPMWRRMFAAALLNAVIIAARYLPVNR